MPPNWCRSLRSCSGRSRSRALTPSGIASRHWALRRLRCSSRRWGGFAPASWLDPTWPTKPFARRREASDGAGDDGVARQVLGGVAVRSAQGRPDGAAGPLAESARDRSPAHRRSAAAKRRGQARPAQRAARDRARPVPHPLSRRRRSPRGRDRARSRPQGGIQMTSPERLAPRRAVVLAYFSEAAAAEAHWLSWSLVSPETPMAPTSLPSTRRGAAPSTATALRAAGCAGSRRLWPARPGRPSSALVERGRSRLGDGDVGAAELRVVELLVIDEHAGRTDNARSPIRKNSASSPPGTGRVWNGW